jgi:hypothetical protein
MKVEARRRWGQVEPPDPAGFYTPRIKPGRILELYEDENRFPITCGQVVGVGREIAAVLCGEGKWATLLFFVGCI